LLSEFNFFDLGAHLIYFLEHFYFMFNSIIFNSCPLIFLIDLETFEPIYLKSFNATFEFGLTIKFIIYDWICSFI